MDVAVERTLRSHYAKFEKRADCNVILGELYANGFLDEYKKQNLISENNSFSRNRLLMDYMIGSLLDVDRFTLFCTVMEKTLDYNEFTNSLRTQMAIHCCENTIKEKVKLTSLVPLLEEEDVLTSKEAERLLSARDEDAKELLDILQWKDADNYMTFLFCLQDPRAGAHHHELAKIIKDEIGKLHSFKRKKASLGLPYRKDSGISSPMTSVQATDLSDGFLRLAIIEEGKSCDPSFAYIIQGISEELRVLDEQHADELERLQSYYEEMRLVLTKKENDAENMLRQLHRRQKKHLEAVKKDVRKYIMRREKTLPAKFNWLLPYTRPDAYMKVTTDSVAMDQLQSWNVPIVVGSAHYDNTKAKGPGLKWAYTNKIATFTVELRDIENRLLIAKSVADMMDLTSNFDCMIVDSEGSVVPSSQQIAPSITGWVEGIKCITYVPTVTGYLDISVKCTGHPIGGSPFRVLAYPLSEYYKLMTQPQKILSFRKSITGLALTRSGDAAICTEDGELYIVKHMAGEYDFIDIAAYHGGMSLNLPSGLSCDADDNLVIANTGSSQIVKASSPEGNKKLCTVSSKLKFDPICVAAHESIVAAGGTKDVVVCNANLVVLHTVSFSSSISALSITNNLNIHVAISETIGDKEYNYACIDNTNQTKFAQLLPSKTTNGETTSGAYRINDIITDKEQNMIVCYADQPVVAMFNSNGQKLSCYEKWGPSWFGGFSAVAVSHLNGLLLVDHTRHELMESHLDKNLETYTPFLEETDFFY